MKKRNVFDRKSQISGILPNSILTFGFPGFQEEKNDFVINSLIYHQDSLFSDVVCYREGAVLCWIQDGPGETSRRIRNDLFSHYCNIFYIVQCVSSFPTDAYNLGSTIDNALCCAMIPIYRKII